MVGVIFKSLLVGLFGFEMGVQGFNFTTSYELRGM